MVDCSIIIVSWNVADYVAACLASITSSRFELEIIVVDSASQDDTVARVRRDFPHVRVMPQTQNVGYTRGNNIGLAAASGRHLLLLNPDTEIVGDALTPLIAYLDAHPNVGIIGPHTLNTDHTTQSTRRRFPTIPLAFLESTWLQPLAPKALLAHYYVSDLPDDGVYEVDWVQGSALMMRREVYAQIGGMDENYVMFFEELDLCKRARNAGWRVVYDGEAQIVHHGGKSTDQVAARKHIYFQESKLRYFRKYHGPAVALLLRAFLLLSYMSQMVIEGLKGLIGSKRAIRVSRVQAYWQVLRSGLKVR